MRGDAGPPGPLRLFADCGDRKVCGDCVCGVFVCTCGDWGCECGDGFSCLTGDTYEPVGRGDDGVGDSLGIASSDVGVCGCDS